MPTKAKPPITWAPRVRQALIQRLYDLDALGIRDEELIDKVGWGLYSRCQSFIGAVEATRGRVKCPHCGTILQRTGEANEVLRCACGWETAWKEFFKTIQHQQLSGADPVMAFYQDYIDQFPKTRDPEKKIVLIDTLIHSFHYRTLQELQKVGGRITGVNLIEGNMHEVIAFLNRLSYGYESTPGLREKLTEWRKIVHRAATIWQDMRTLREMEKSGD